MWPREHVSVQLHVTHVCITFVFEEYHFTGEKTRGNTCKMLLMKSNEAVMAESRPAGLSVP